MANILPVVGDDWHDIYVSLRDPSEYQPAIQLAGSWDKWKRVRTSVRYKETIDSWAEEVEALLASEAIEAMKAHAQQPGGTAAAKWLAEKSYKDRKGVGRPKKLEAPVEASGASQRVSEDALRLFAVK
jgi:hypothetical protein